jgi:hypothetical protein
MLRWPVNKEKEKRPMATPEPIRSVQIVDVKIPFLSLVAIFVKAALAVIPAAIILTLIGVVIGVVFGGIFGTHVPPTR